MSRGGAPALPINAVSEQRVEGYRMDGGKDGPELILIRVSIPMVKPDRGGFQLVILALTVIRS